MKLKPPLPAIATPEVGGVRMRRHVLDAQASGLAHLARRLRTRLVYALRELPEGAMPDRDWRETYELYERTVTNLLKEQRERAKLKPAGPERPEDGAPLTPEEEAELRELAKGAIDTIATEPEGGDA